MNERQTLREQLQGLKLFTMAEAFEKEAEKAAVTKMSYTGYLARLVEEEVLVKTERSINARVAKSRFPAMKTLEGFDFSFQPNLSEPLIKELAALGFMDRAENVIFLGPPGVGKTHLAVALGVRACQAKKRVLFIQAGELMDQLAVGLVDRSINARLDNLSRLDILIIDELGYMPMDKGRANLFFQLISKRYERGSVMITTNRAFEEWAEVFGDEVIAGALLDRVLHHCHIIPINGPSYRVKDKRKRIAGE